MADFIPPISPKPFDGFSLLVGASAVVELDPQPYANTKEVILRNSSATGDMLVSVERLIPAPASGDISWAGNPWPLTTGQAMLGVVAAVDDTFTIDGNVFTAVAPPVVANPANFEFSVPVQATATITINVGGAGTLNAGDKIEFVHVNGSFTRTLTAGVPVPGNNQWDAAAVGDVAIAAAIAAAANDTTNDPYQKEAIQSAVAVGNTVVFTISSGKTPNDTSPQTGASGNTSIVPSSISFGSGNRTHYIQVSTAVAGAITVANDGAYSGGLDGRFDFGTAGVQDSNDVALHISEAIRRSLPAKWRGLLSYGVDRVVTETVDIVACAVNLGVAGNGLVIAESTGGLRFAVTSPTSGGVDAVPAALSSNSSVTIPPSSSISLPIGSDGNRNALGTRAFWNQNLVWEGFGSGLGILVMNTGAAAASLHVTYVNNRGYPWGV